MMSENGLFSSVDSWRIMPNMILKAPWSRILRSVLMGVALTAAVSFLQPRFKAGSISDLVCELVLLPGKVFATLFRDRGNASPEFLWRSRIATAVALTGVAWCGFAVRHRRTESPTAPRR